MTRKLHRIAIALSAATMLLMILAYLLGSIKNESSGRGSEFKWTRLGQERAKDIIYWDRLGLSTLGWNSARSINRAIGVMSGQGNNSARGWILVIGCGGVTIIVGSCVYFTTILIGHQRSKRLAEQAAPRNR